MYIIFMTFHDSGLPAKAIDLDEHEKALLNEDLDASPGVSWDAIAGLEEVKRFLAIPPSRLAFGVIMELMYAILRIFKII